ncbi:PKD domain-containing protein, partial [bacterium]|nr:PKD domain-containing protein [bacterium]
MKANTQQLKNWQFFLIFVAVILLLIPQTGWTKWKIKMYEQARNDDGDGPYTWVTGNITHTHSKYYEADAIPFRLYMTGLTVGTHTLKMTYQCTKGGKMAYDYLVSWDHSEPDAPITEDIDVSGFTEPTLFPIPLDPDIGARGVTQLPGNFTLYNGTITAFSTYTHDGDTTADCHTRFTITFTADGPEILLAWGGHISTLYDWGEGNSASYIPGSPYHMSLLKFDGASTGNRDLATAAAAIEVLELDFGDAPDPTYPTLLASNGPNHVITFNMSLGPTVYPEPDGLPSPNADGDDLNAGDDEEGITFPAPLVAGSPGIITVDGGPSGGLLDAWIDFDGNGQFNHPAELLNGGSIALIPGPGNTITIPVPLTAVPGMTYARFRLSSVGGLPPTGPANDGEVEDHTVFIEQQVGTIIIEKQTDPDGAPDIFTFTGDANGMISDGQQITVSGLAPGTYTSQELVPAGWDLMSIVLDDSNSTFDLNTATATFVLEPGEIIKAIFTNTLQRGTIIIEKQTDPDGVPVFFIFSGDASGTISDGGQIVVNNLLPGQYASQEIVPAGWEVTSIALNDGNSVGDVNMATATFNLEAGETVKAVFTNTLKVTEIEVEKNADVFWERTYEWDIEKTVTPTEWHLFHGESGESQYTVTVTRSVLSDMVTVSGQICVTNSGQIATSGLTYIDTLQYRTPQMNDWGVIKISMDTPGAISPGETDCYKYEFTFEAIPDAEYRNVVVARITNFAGYEGQLFGPQFVIPVNLPQVPDKENNPIAHVKDTNGKQWEFTDSGSENYNRTFVCDENEGTNGNTATILETGQSASVTVMVYCHELEIEKDAKASFNRYYQWMIDKEAEAERIELAACFEEQVPYTVTVDTTGYVDTDFMVKGKITIHNPAPTAAVINSLEDLLNGQPAQLDCQPQFPLTIEPGGTFECVYQKTLPTGEQLVNIAKAVQQLFSYSFEGQPEPMGTTTHEGTADVIFTDPEIELDECVTVTDTNLDPTLLGNICAADAPKIFAYSLTVGPYYASGEHIINNTATYITNDTGTKGSDSWTLLLAVECVPPVANFEADIVDAISPMTVQFTDLSENAIRWLWEFSDGSTSTEQHPVHIFRNPPLKYYTVKLTVWGCCEDYADTMVKEKYIRVTRAAEVKFNASPLVVAPNKDVQFINHCGGGVNRFEWNFGDGNILKLHHNVMAKIHPTHAYAVRGSYTVSLFAYGQGGEGTFTVKDMIYVAPNFVNMKFLEGSKTLPNELWENAVNHDIISSNANAVALNKNAYAIFRLVNDANPIRFNKLRILSNNGLGT